MRFGMLRTFMLSLALMLMGPGKEISDRPEVNILISWNSATLEGIRDSKLGADGRTSFSHCPHLHL